MWLSILFVIVGIGLVLMFAGRLVKGTVGFARGFGISAFVVSVVFLGFDPENLAVGAVGAYEGAEGIALGTIVGSAMVAIALAFGITALIVPLRFEQAPRRGLAGGSLCRLYGRRLFALWRDAAWSGQLIGERSHDDDNKGVLHVPARPRRSNKNNASRNLAMKWRDLFNTKASEWTILVRLLVGLVVFFPEGLQKLLFPEILGAGRFAAIGIPYPDVMGPFVGVFDAVPSSSSDCSHGLRQSR